MKLISVVTPCYNEEGNVEKIHEEIKSVFSSLKGKYSCEHIYIDNASKDRTRELLRGIAARDPAVKVILNTRNFGHIRSPYYGLLQARGDAAILMASDLQDPPLMILDFIKKWEEGFKVVMGVKTESEETPLMFALRKLYYTVIARISDVELVKN